MERAEGGRLQPGATAGGPQARVPGRRPSRTLAGDRAPHATERSGRAPRAAPTHPFSWGAVWACVSLDTGMNRSVSLGLDRPEPRGGGQAEHGAHLVASLAFLSRGSWLSRLSLRGQALIHLRPPVPAALPGSGLPGPGPPGPAVAGGGGGHLPHLRGALCSPASQAPRQLQALPGKTRRVGHAQPVLGQRPRAALPHPDSGPPPPPTSLHDRRLYPHRVHRSQSGPGARQVTCSLDLAFGDVPRDRAEHSLPGSLLT